MSVKDVTICLDAGHEGYYNRSPVVPAYYESVFNFKLQGYLVTELASRGLKSIVTRNSLEEVQKNLLTRGKTAKGCAVFLSLHSNACSSKATKRISIYHFRDNDNWTVDEESKAIGDALGKAILSAMPFCGKYELCTREASSDRDKNGLHDDEYYGVLEGAKMVSVPGLILEHGFHTNTETATWLLDDENIKSLAVAEADALYAYFSGVTVEQTTETAETGETVSDAVASGVTDSLYHVRDSLNTASSQLGAFNSLRSATNLAKKHSGYCVFYDGEKVYPEETTVVGNGYLVQVQTSGSSLRVRNKPTTVGSSILGSYSNGFRVRVYAENNGWGRVLFNGKEGWICLKYTKKI